MVPMQRLSLEEDMGYDSEDNQGDALLYHLQLHQRERSPIVHEAYAVGGHLATILEKGDQPGESDNGYQRPVLTDPCLLQLQMSIPRESHEHVAQHEQQHGI